MNTIERYCLHCGYAIQPLINLCSKCYRPADPVPYRSIVLWPDEVSTGKTPNESRDTHPSREAAEIVCRRIEREGLGGEGKVFPLSTRVEPIA